MTEIIPASTDSCLRVLYLSQSIRQLNLSEVAYQIRRPLTELLIKAIECELNPIMTLDVQK